MNITDRATNRALMRPFSCVNKHVSLQLFQICKHLWQIYNINQISLKVLHGITFLHVEHLLGTQFFGDVTDDKGFVFEGQISRCWVKLLFCPKR